MKIGKRIITLRSKHGVTQTELGNAIGVGKTTISNYETGYSTPDAETLVKIADFFDVSLDYLFARTNEPDHPTKTTPNWLNKFIKLMKNQRGEALPEAMPLLIMEVVALYAYSKGILPPGSLSSVTLPKLTERETNQLVDDIDKALYSSDSESKIDILAQEIESLPPKERQAMEAMLDVLKHRDDNAAAQES